MGMVNQQGQPIEEEDISFSYLSLEERKEAVDLLFKHLRIHIIRTNKGYGQPALELREEP